MAAVSINPLDVTLEKPGSRDLACRLGIFRIAERRYVGP
jgi:hypothetical protein